MANLANNADKLSVVAGTLANTLKGEVKIIDIIETIKNISNFKSETLENIDLNPNLYKDNLYDDVKSGYIMAISDLPSSPNRTMSSHKREGNADVK